MTASANDNDHARPCPQCGKPAADAYRPFCSRRCADLDLAGWFNESYRVPANAEDEPDADDPEGDSRF